MKVKKMREAIILAMLKDGLKSRQELEMRLDIEKKITRNSLSFLKTSGLVNRYQIDGSEYYNITESGRHVVNNVFKRR